jgi:TonB family protein
LIADRVFLAFETGQGRAYVQASGWQRIYLLWTFRNFRGVPHKILNARQRQMVESLYPAASIHLGPEIDEDTVIGTVEDFVPRSPVPVSVSAATSASTATMEPVSRIAARKLARESARALFHGYSGWPAFAGLTRTVSTGAVVAIVAVATWQQLRNRPVVSASSSRFGAMQQSRAEKHADQARSKEMAAAIVPSRSGALSQPIPQAQIASAALIAVAPPPAISSLRSKASQSPAASQPPGPLSKKREADHNMVSARVSVRAAEVAGRQDDPNIPLRIKISGPPQKLVYPVCPDSSTRGKVSLQAVVDYDGTVSQVRVLGGNRLLANAAKRAIREWRYQPSSADAQKLEREARVTVSFISDDVVAVSFPDDAPVSR